MFLTPMLYYYYETYSIISNVFGFISLFPVTITMKAYVENKKNILAVLSFSLLH